MPSFQKRISEIAPGVNYRHVEAMMRDHKGPHLDFLSPEEFRERVLECVPLAKEHPARAESLAAKQRLRTEET